MLRDASYSGDLIEKHPTPTILVDLKGDIVLANKAARDVMAIPSSQAERETLWSADYLEAGDRQLDEVLRVIAGTSDWMPLRLTLKTGPRRGLRFNFRARGVMPRGNPKPLAFLVFDGLRDENFAEHTRLVIELNQELSELRRVKAQLDTALTNEKALHRELIHRVKNNLALLAALTRSRIGDVESDESKEVLRNIQFRIRAIALVHELLDRKSEIQLIDADEFLGELCTLMESSICPSGVKIVHDVAPLRLHIEDATPLCLLINELVTNSLKHAFAGRQSGEISLVFRRNGTDKLELRLTDDGHGVSQDDTDGSGGQGMRIVEALAQQLGGELVRSDDGGTTWTLIFKPERTNMVVAAE